jgi:hypothetical protein
MISHSYSGKTLNLRNRKVHLIEPSAGVSFSKPSQHHYLGWIDESSSSDEGANKNSNHLLPARRPNGIRKRVKPHKRVHIKDYESDCSQGLFDSSSRSLLQKLKNKRGLSKLRRGHKHRSIEWEEASTSMESIGSTTASVIHSKEGITSPFYGQAKRHYNLHGGKTQLNKSKQTLSLIRETQPSLEQKGRISSH